MVLIVDAENVDFQYKTTEEFVNHFGIIPAKKNDFQLVYYSKSMVYYTGQYKFYKKIINCSRKTYKVFELNRKPVNVPIN